MRWFTIIGIKIKHSNPNISDKPKAKKETVGLQKSLVEVTVKR